MADPESRYFTLTLESLRAIGGWTADCAERALSVYEAHSDSDTRPRAAIAGIREFAAGGKRVARLRTLALEAHAAGREAGDPAAAAAARAAGTAAASAYTHPLADVHQTKHIVGAAAYAALALELAHAGDTDIGDREVRWAIEHAPSEAREVLLQMPAREAGKSRWEALLYAVDAGLRVRTPRYAGRRDPRFVAIHRGGLLDESTHRLLAAWAADCAEHVLPLFASACPDDERPARAIETARAWSRGQVSVTDAREAAYAAHAAAREVADPVARAVARACGHAVATAHMADHELGAPFYAIRAVRLASAAPKTQAAGERECRWQRDRLPDAIRELVLSDQGLRAAKFQSVFDC